MDGTNYSLSDMATAMGNDRDGFGGSGSIWLLFLFIFFALFNNNGFGGNRNAYETCATQGQMTDQFNFEAIRQGQADIVAAVKEQNANVIGTVKDTAYNNLGAVKDLEAAVAQNGFSLSQCCCETNRNIDSVKFDMANYACQIQKTNTENTQRVLDALTANRMADLQNENMRYYINSQLCGIPRISNLAYGVTPLNWCNSGMAYNPCGCN